MSLDLLPAGSGAWGRMEAASPWGQRQRVIGALHGDLSPDGRIVLSAAGSDADKMRIDTLVTKLTATRTEIGNPPTGVFTIPCTWANIVQIGWTFGQIPDLAWVPGEALQAWMAAESDRRFAPLPELEPSWPPWLAPRDYQVEAARMIAAARKFFLLDDMGLGKAQPETTPIWTPAGWTRLGSLRSGDLVYDRYGRATRVKAIHYQGERPVFRVTFSDRTSTLADGGHLWRAWTANDRARGSKHGRVLTTDQLREAGLRDPAGNRKFFLPQQPVILSGSDLGLPLDPYAYGALLGDGSLGGAHLSIACPDESVIRRVLYAVARLDTTSRLQPVGDRCLTVVFHRNGRLRTILGNLGALRPSGEKSVHSRYLDAGVSGRRELLAGLLDTDGYVADGCIEFSSASVQLAADVAFLARSLGAVVTESDPQPAGYRNRDGERVTCQDKHRLTIRFPAGGPNPFRLPRKADAWSAMAAGLQRSYPPRAFETIEPAGTARVCCIELDTDDENARVYLTDRSLIPTHNTIVTLLGLEQIRRTGGVIFPLVILVPSWDVADGWHREIVKWMPSAAWLEPMMYEGTSRTRLLRHPGVNVIISTYATARLDAADIRGPLVRYGPASVVVDEASLIKNARAKQAAAAERIAAHAANVIILSGTLITRDTGDVFPALKTTDPGTWPDKKRFRKRFCLVREDEHGEVITGLNPYTTQEFRACLASQMIRRAKADVLKELPEKTYSVIRPEIPDVWMRAYRQMEEDMLAELPEGGELSVMDTLSKITRLMQLASSAADVTWEDAPVVVDGHVVGTEQKAIVKLRSPSWKAEALMPVMDQRTAPVAVFMASRQLALITGEDYLKKAGYQVGYVIGTGWTPGGSVTRGTRKRDIERFQAGELDALVCTAGAGGVGITLTAADTVVFLQRPWPLDQAVQPEDRVHRMGNLASKIQIIDIVAKGTVDQRVRDLLRNKAGQLSEFARDPRIVRELLGGNR